MTTTDDIDAVLGDLPELPGAIGLFGAPAGTLPDATTFDVVVAIASASGG